MRSRQTVRGMIGALRRPRATPRLRAAPWWPRVTPRRVAALLLAVGLAAGAGAATTAVLSTKPGSWAAHAEARGMGRSAPVRIAIPVIGVDVEVVPLRLRAGELESPPAGRAGWYAQGTSPGEPGSAVIVGAAAGPGGPPAVFGRLARLAPGDRITVLRADLTRARFEVERVVAYSPVKPGGSGNGTASLRLVPAYRDGPSPPAQPVVFARLTP